MHLLTAQNFTYRPSLKHTMPASKNNKSNTSSEERNLRARLVHGYGLVPHTDNIFIPPRVKEVDVLHTMEDNPERKKSIMYLQLIQILSGSNSGQNSGMTAFQTYLKKNKKESSSSSSYYRLFLFRDVASSEGQVVYMIEGNNLNDKLWARDSMLRDDGDVTIGTYIALLNPCPITSTWCNEIPIVEGRGGCIVMKPPTTVMEINIDTSILGNYTHTFVKSHVDIKVVSVSVHNSKCGGLFCDRQRCVKIDRGTRACGCYSMNTRISSIVLVHHIQVIYLGKVLFEMEDFSSLSFSKLYMKTSLSPTVKFNCLDYTPAYYKLQDCIDNVLEYVNTNGGFTVIGWYKRGEINDISIDDSQNVVESETNWYHVVSMYPTNKDLIKNPELKEEQFDIAAPIV